MDEEKNNGVEEMSTTPADVAEKEPAEIAERIEREGIRHVTPPGDPEFPEDEYGFAQSSHESTEKLEKDENLSENTADKTPSEKAADVSDSAAHTLAEAAVTPVTKENYQDLPQKVQPEPIKTKWNWGAFSFTLFFGVAHRAYLGLLILLGLVPWIGPIFALVWAIIFGFNGEKWALENPDNHYRDEEEFRKVMDGWNRAGLVGFIIGIVAVVLSIVFIVAMLIWLVNTPEFHNDLMQNLN